MHVFKIALWRFMKGFVIGFVAVNLALLALFLPTVGNNAHTFIFASALSGLLATFIGFQEVFGTSGPEPEEEPSWFFYWRLCYSPLEMFWKTCLLSTVSTFCLNVVGWGIYWTFALQPAWTNIKLNFWPITTFSLVVGAVAGGYKGTKFWFQQRC